MVNGKSCIVLSMTAPGASCRGDMIVDASAIRRETANSVDSISAMGHFAYPAAEPPKPRARGADLANSIVVLVLTGLMGALASVLGLFSLAFLDNCPPATCSAQGAATAVGTAVFVGFGIVVVGLVLTVVQLVRGKPGWPFAVATLVLCATAIVFGGVGYAGAVG
jgi:hypothetical protein